MMGSLLAAGVPVSNITEFLLRFPRRPRAVFAGRIAAPPRGRDADISREFERAERTKIDGL